MSSTKPNVTKYTVQNMFKLTGLNMSDVKWHSQEINYRLHGNIYQVINNKTGWSKEVIMGLEQVSEPETWDDNDDWITSNYGVREPGGWRGNVLASRAK